jgi:hypothetical protein
MLSALSLASRTSLPTSGLLASQATAPASTSSNDEVAPSGATLGPATERASASPFRALSNYGLPRNVVIARLTAGATATGHPDPSPPPPAASDAPESASSDAIADPAWGLSIASRYVGSYATPGRAAAAALDLVA